MSGLKYSSINQIVYCAINPEWNSIKSKYKEVVKNERVEVVPNVDQTFESNIRSRVGIIIAFILANI